MKRFIKYILFATLIFSCVVPVQAQTRNNTQMTAQQKQRAAEKAKRDKERQKQQAARQKQQQKQQAERAKQQQKQQAEKDKIALQREKQQKAEEAKYDKPIKQSEAIHYFNISGRAGYAAMFDNIGTYGKVLPAVGVEYPLMDKSLTGGAGAGLQLSYELAYHTFRFETGIGFDWLNSRSDYAFSMSRPLVTYPQTYFYMTDDLKEVRNLGLVSIPIMAGAQFSRYYFMLGARIGYGLFGTFKQSGLYDVTVNDDDYLKPYGMGIISAPQPESKKLTLRQPDVRLAAEFGIDLDEWLQAEPDKRRRQVKPGERYPFSKENIHYKLALFADYGILNSNGMSGTYPLSFADNSSWQPTASNTMLGLDGTIMNNLFVGAKFTVQFEIPSKRPPMQPVRPTYLDLQVVDTETGKPINATLVLTNMRTNKQSTPREMRGGTAHRSISKGDWQISVAANDYYSTTQDISIAEAGQNQNITLQLKHVPYFRMKVTDAETGRPLPVNAQITRRGETEVAYQLNTDSLSGAARTILPEAGSYNLHIDLIGYDSYDTQIASVGDSMNIMMRPVKKGEVFVMKNLFFATNKTRILKASEESLSELAGFLNRNQEVRVKIIGHTDNVGSDAANQRLSEGRAAAVREELIERGIDATRIEAEGRGESQPIDTNDTEEGRQNNRRVEVEIL